MTGRGGGMETCGAEGYSGVEHSNSLPETLHFFSLPAGHRQAPPSARPPAARDPHRVADGQVPLLHRQPRLPHLRGGRRHGQQAGATSTSVGTGCGHAPLSSSTTSQAPAHACTTEGKTGQARGAGGTRLGHVLLQRRHAALPPLPRILLPPVHQQQHLGGGASSEGEAAAQAGVGKGV